MADARNDQGLTSSAFRFHPSSLWRLGRLIRKEVLSILRDRRTIITLILMPLLLYPLLTIAFQQFVLGNSPADLANINYSVGFRLPAQKQAIQEFLLLGRQSIQGNRYPWPADLPENQPLPGLASTDEEIIELESDIMTGVIHVGMRPTGPQPTHIIIPGELSPFDPFDERPLPRHAAIVDTYVFQLLQDRELKCSWEIVYREDIAVSREAAQFLQHVIAAANAEFQSARMRLLERPQQPAPVFAKAMPIKEHHPPRTASMAVLIPLILILMTITGAVYPAIDLTAGERERGTLETLVAAPIPRFGLLFAKYIAVFIVAVLTAFANLGTMTVTLMATGLGKVFGAHGLTAMTLVQVFGLMLLLAAFFSAVLLVITSFARSFKEAQAYLIPLMLAALLPGMLPLLDPKLSLDGANAVVPLLNIVLLARDLFSHQALLWTAVVVVISTLIYSLAAVALAAKLFGAEGVLYNEQSGWADLFRRPKEPAATPSISSALFCVAVMFPLSFMLTGLQIYLSGDSYLKERLVLGGCTTVFVFGVVPTLWARFSGARLTTSFRLRLPPVWACVGGVLLGVSLWPFVHELFVFMRSVGISALRPELQKAAELALGQWRTISPFWIVLVYAILPAVLEEITFRGYLYSALNAAGGPRTAILVSAIIFGVFHLILSNSLAVDRLLTTTLLGLVLGVIAWRSGSVIPGMIFHALHNSTLVLLGYYKPQLEGWDWVPQEEGYLPLGWLIGSAVVAGVGFLLVMVARKRPGTEASTQAAVPD